MRNKILNRTFCAVLTVVLCLGLLAAVPTIKADAAAAGTTMSNAVEANFSSSYFKSWTKDTDHLNHYVKFAVPQRGIVTITADKPFDSEGEYGRLYFTVYDGNGDPIWGNDSYKSVDDAKDKYVVNVGLASGTYYLTLKPGFYVTSGLIETWYKLSFRADSYCEIEENGSGSCATAVELKKKYTGWYGAAGSDYEEGDYYKVPVVSGRTYRIVWYNFSAMGRTNTIVDFLMPDGTSKGISYSLEDYINSDGYNYCDVSVKTSGSAYIHIYNSVGPQFEYGFMISEVVCQSGHKYGSWSTSKYATCAAAGSEKRTCSTCGNTETRSISKLSHSFGSWTTVNKATCAKAGSEKRTCSTCGNTETRSISKLAHNYGSWTTVKNATCAKEGSEKSTCNTCGEVVTRAISKLAHTLGDCTSVDVSIHKVVCAVCSEEFTDFHQWDSGTPKIPATCLNEGVMEHKCRYCNGTTTSRIPFSQEHQYTNDCDTECDICYQTRNVTHNYAQWQMNENYHWHACSVCGKEENVSVHTPGAEATEYSAQTCTVCGYEIVPMLEQSVDGGVLLVCLAILMLLGTITAVLVIKKRQ